MNLPGKQHNQHSLIGVTTTKSIMKVFPLWQKHCLKDAVIKGIDIEIHAESEVYREVVVHQKRRTVPWRTGHHA